MGEGTKLKHVSLPGRVRQIERRRLSGYQSLGPRKHLEEPQNGYKNIILLLPLEVLDMDMPGKTNSGITSRMEHCVVEYQRTGEIYTFRYSQD